jgi:uncharacterized protein
MQEIKGKGNLILMLVLVGAILIMALNTKSPDVNISSQPGELRNTISVSGTGIITASPDEAELYIRIITEAADAKTAQDDNADITEDVRNALKNKGVSEDDMETSSYYLSPKTSWDRETGESEIYGYTLTHMLKVTTKDIKNTGKLADAAVGAGANGLGNVNFKLSDELRDKAYSEALEVASASASEKAGSIASALKVDLGELINVAESGTSYTPYRYYDMAESAVPKAAGAETVISPQDVEVTAYVSLVYEIE